MGGWGVGGGWGLQPGSTRAAVFLQHPAAAACSTAGRGAAANEDQLCLELRTGWGVFFITGSCIRNPPI